MIKINHDYPQFELIEVVNPDSQELLELHDHYELNEEMLNYATDRFESPRYEFDQKNDLIILNSIADQTKSEVEIQPLAFFIQNPNRLITFTNNLAVKNIIEKFPKAYLEAQNPNSIKPLDLVLNAFFNITAKFLDTLEEVERKQNFLQKTLSHHRNSEYLSELLNVKVELIYYLNALQRNHATLEQFKNAKREKIDASEKEFLEDIEIEMKQALDMANVSTKMMNLLSDAYENIINNNTNRSMSILTVASIVLAIPAIVVGFFGMNIDLPMTKGTFSWILITIGTTIIMIWVYRILKHRGFF
ncbi:MAG: magnesium transporter CorA family protein [Lactobacillaceae bacterium]